MNYAATTFAARAATRDAAIQEELRYPEGLRHCGGVHFATNEAVVGRIANAYRERPRRWTARSWRVSTAG